MHPILRALAFAAALLSLVGCGEGSELGPGGELLICCGITVALLGNVVKFTEPGRRVRLAVDHRGGEQAITLADSGIGIDPERIGSRFRGLPPGETVMEPAGASEQREVRTVERPMGCRRFDGSETPCRLLVVDDNRYNLEVIESLLANLGFEVITAGNGEDGVWTAVGRRPDLVLMDLVTEGMQMGEEGER